MTVEAAVLWLALLLAAEPAGKPELMDLRVTVEGRRVTVSFQLANAFREPILERLQSGLPTPFVFEFGLFRDHKRWFDRRLDAAELEVATTYDAVTREYLIHYKRDGKLVESRVVRELAELEQAMSHFDEVPLFTLGEVSRKWRLLVKARADLGSRNFLSFIPLRIATDWAESRKFRVP